ncbi:MAG: ABC transporter permease [Synergistaceae bacterium]|jgi:putative ABC transport system permease protein|nr:ABC transporter permease [Synergistaceae bacterium]
MTKRQMYMKMLFSSLLRRRSRMTVALLAIAIGATVLLGMTTITYDIPRQMEREFRSYGANMVFVASGGEALLRLADVEKASALLPRDSLIGVAPYRYEAVRSNMQPYTVVGTDFEQVRKTSPYWQIQGAWPEEEDEILIGTDVAEFTRLMPGGAMTLSGRDARRRRFNREMAISGIVRTGSVEDGFLFMRLDTLERLTGKEGEADVAEVSIAASEAELSSLVSRIREQVPAVTPRLVKRVTQSETSVLSKLQALVYLVTLVVLVLTMICVATTMMTVVMERRKEIGLKKAIGAENRSIVAEFLGEGLFLGMLGGALGVVFGWLFAQTISMNVFGRSISFNFALAPATVLASMAVTALACLIPVRRATDVEPALVLRGE